MTGSVEPRVVLLHHGVGLDPELFASMRAVMNHSTIAPTRSPYTGATPETVAGQACELLDRWREHESVTVVGVSGGATIALAMAMQPTPNLRAVIAHEPLVGPLAPDLHDGVVRAAAQLAHDPAEDAPDRFVSGLVGSTLWHSLPASARRFTASHRSAIRNEVPRFVAFAPSIAELKSIEVPVMVTTGARSPQRRHAAADALVRHAGARSVVVAGAGHLAHWEQPDRFAALVESEIARS